MATVFKLNLDMFFSLDTTMHKLSVKDRLTLGINSRKKDCEASYAAHHTLNFFFVFLLYVKPQFFYLKLYKYLNEIEL